MDAYVSPQPDALRPTEEAALRAWADRCEADRRQVERCREVDDPADYYAPVADRFRVDPNRDEDVLDALLAEARPGDTWLDIGAGGGRYALPLALRVTRVAAIDPSRSMLTVLADGMREHGIDNVTAIEARWPDPAVALPPIDVALMAHVGYDIAAMGPFLAAAEAVARRRCIAVMGEGAMTTAATLFWQRVHREPRVRLPALPELLTLLVARGRLPAITLASRPPVVFESLDDLLTMARRQLWVRPGSDKDARLDGLVRATATEREAGWSLDWEATVIGVVAWSPPGTAGAVSPRFAPAPG